MKLNFKVYGQGPSLIILHGLFGSLDNWVGFAKKLSDDYSVYLIDQRDHGKSPHTDDFNYHLLSQDLEEFMDTEGIYRSHIMGHSMGGKTAMQFALDYPDRVESLTVVDIAPIYYEPRHKDVFAAMDLINFDQLESRMDALDVLKKSLNDATAAFLTKNIKRTPNGGFQWKMNVDLLRSKYEEISDGITADDPYEGPAMFVKAQFSDYISKKDEPLILSLFPEAKFHEIAEAGHWIHADQPLALLSLLRLFLDEVDS